ncbi:hypothetical protein B1813_09410 [Saccharomonospora piscinae]|uniref:Lipoprotein n=1 Tax=Saccharomonospora piscinae TaxID=687388 RepID=A0A1V9A5K1_SACPI|nr:hypothetical protein [Saccharomonospora piscinae]OQO92409.1 hypothetical protein B1813_09410 [Saccharomonospora piscinae]
MSARSILATLFATLPLFAAVSCGSEPAPVQGAPQSTPESQAVASAAAPEDDAAVRESFDRYLTTLRDTDGEAAARLVTSTTIRHYGELATLAATGGPGEIGRRSLIDRLNIALVRHHLATEQLEAMDGPALFVVAVERGLIDKAQVETLTLGEITVSGDRAVAAAEDEGGKGTALSFARERGTWRLDLMPLIETSDRIMTELAARHGVSEDELVFRLASTATGTTVDESVFAKP